MTQHITENTKLHTLDITPEGDVIIFGLTVSVDRLETMLSNAAEANIPAHLLYALQMIEEVHAVAKVRAQ